MSAVATAAATETPAVTQRRRARPTELALLVLAVGIGIAAQAAVDIDALHHIPVSLAYDAAALVGIFGVAHLAMRRWAPAGEPLLLPLAALLNGIGLAEIHRIDIELRAQAIATHSFIPRPDAPFQLVWTGVGIAVFVAVLALLRDYRRLASYIYTAAALGIGLLILPGLPVLGETVNGARLWVHVGPLTFQPGQTSEVLLIVFIAGFLVRKRDVLSVVNRSFLGFAMPRLRDLGPLLLAWGIAISLLVVEHDIGTPLLFFGVFLAMLYIATERISWGIIGVGLFASGIYVAFELFYHVRERFDIWLHAFAGTNPDNVSYQLVQGLFGLASGGILGTGLGRGRPGIVPFAQTDFITAAIGEELGLVGLTAVIVVYGIMVARGLGIGVAARDSFGKLLAAGLACSLAFQVFVVIGGVTRLIPLTGETIPFLSYGGSALLANYALIAILLRMSHSVRAEEPDRSSTGRPVALAAAAPGENPTEVIRR